MHVNRGYGRQLELKLNLPLFLCCCLIDFIDGDVVFISKRRMRTRAAGVIIDRFCGHSSRPKGLRRGGGDVTDASREPPHAICFVAKASLRSINSR